MNSIEEQAYIEGFMSKCAEHGINKEAQLAKLLGGARKGLTGYWNALSGSRARAANELSGKLRQQLDDAQLLRSVENFGAARDPAPGALKRIYKLDDRIDSLRKRTNKVEDMADALRSQRNTAQSLTAAGAAGGLGLGIQNLLEGLAEDRKNLG